MNKLSIAKAGAGVVTAAVLLASALPAFAQTVSVSASTTGAGSTARLSTIITTSNANIAARLTDLNKLNTQVQAMKNESAAEKSNISAQVQTNITGLTTLQAKIDADTDASTARADAASVFTAFRIYALIVPRGYLLAGADRVTTITGLMTALSTQIQARITADQNAGKNVSTITAALADMQAKVTDAISQAAAIQSGVSGLMPDQGNATVAASNKATLETAHTNTKTAIADLTSARTDINTMLAGLKALGSVSSTSGAQ
jgi:hypothetical protein